MIENLDIKLLTNIINFIQNHRQLILRKSFGSLIIFFLSYRFLKKFIKKFKTRLIQNYKNTNPFINKLANLIGNILYTIGIITIIMILFSFRGFKVGIILGGISFALGFGLQESIKNFVSGLIFLTNNKIKIGDLVEILGEYGVKGEIKEITLRYTKLKLFDRTTLLIPNHKLIKTPIKTFKSEKIIRGEIIIPLPRYVLLEQIKEILIKSLQNYPYISAKEYLNAYITNFTEKGFELKINFFFDPNGEKNFFVIKTDLRKIILNTLKKYGISLPYNKKIAILSN